MVVVYVKQLASRIRTIASWSCSQAVSKPVRHTPLLCVQWKTPDDGQKNCPKHVEFHSKNKFEKLLYLVAFIIRTYTNLHDLANQNRIISLTDTSEKPKTHKALYYPDQQKHNIYIYIYTNNILFIVSEVGKMHNFHSMYIKAVEAR